MKTLTSILRLALGLLALLFAGTVVGAQEEAAKEKKPSKETMEKFDANKDGMLDDAEKAAAKAAATEKSKATKEANHAKYDANQDGTLDDAEKAAMKADQEAKRDAKKAEMEAKRDAKKATHDAKKEGEKEKN